MIDFQSSCISACVLECGGHDAALAGFSVLSATLWQKSVFIRVHPWLNFLFWHPKSASPCKAVPNCARPPYPTPWGTHSGDSSLSRPPKVIQRYPSLFKGFWRKYFLFFMKFLKANHAQTAFPDRSKLSLDLSNFNQIKVILGKLSHFQEIKDCLFFVAPDRQTSTPFKGIRSAISPLSYLHQKLAPAFRAVSFLA
jgi:hypothetical protein